MNKSQKKKAKQKAKSRSFTLLQVQSIECFALDPLHHRLFIYCQVTKTTIDDCDEFYFDRACLAMNAILRIDLQSFAALCIIHISKNKNRIRYSSKNIKKLQKNVTHKRLLLKI